MEQKAGVFAIYCLYRTQPRKTNTGSQHTPVRIAVSQDDLYAVCELHRTALQTPIDADAHTVLAWLHEHQPFAFVSHRKTVDAEHDSASKRSLMNDPSVLRDGLPETDLATICNPELDDLTTTYAESRRLAGLSEDESGWNPDHEGSELRDKLRKRPKC